MSLRFGLLRLLTFCGLLVGAHAEGQPVNVDVAYLPLLGSAQLFVFEGEGWAKEKGLNLELTRFSSGVAINQAMASGRFDVAVMAISPVIVARSAGINLKVVAAMQGLNTHAFIANEPLAKAYKATASPAEAFKKFNDEQSRPVKIASLPKGTLPDTTIRYYITANHIDPTLYQILGQGDDQVLQSVLSGAADGACLTEPIMTILKHKNSSAEIVAGGRDLMPDHPGFVLAARESFIAEHPDAVKALVELDKRATAFISANPAQAATDVGKFIGGGLLDEKLLASALSSPLGAVAYDPKLIIPGTEKMQDFQMTLGVQSRRIPTDELFDLRFVN